ncbi:unnamed protein product [Rhizoctonia solani]|uniref:Uncharacterized protein n=1 Tax=Rhizoctonia solani TaxID=456999 RepID=A0A8H3D5J0_9AGAM|nr:unnamed protein product [Rhizoctonia solani]
MTRQLTLDVLVLIAEQLAGDKRTLLKVSVLRKDIYLLVLPVLYRSNDFLDLIESFRFCHAILHHSESPGRFVQSLYMQVPFWGIPSSPITPSASIFELIENALYQMPNLQALSLFGFSLFDPIDLSNCPFKLNYLLITPPMTERISKLIRNQPTIVELNLASFTISDQCVDPNHFLDRNVLPNLRTISACPKLIRTLAPGRPIEHVFLQICTIHAMRRVDIITDIASLDQTATPIRSLYVDLDGHNEVTGWSFIELLKTTKVPSSLERLTIKANLLAFATQQAKHSGYFSSIAQLLRGFTCLRHFEVEEAIQGVIEEQPAAHEVINMMFAVLERQIDIGALWRQNCPSLISVKLFERDVL